MARTEQISCDFCGKMKGESNHWFTLYVKGTGQFFTNELLPREMQQWYTLKDLCGESCMLKEIAKCLKQSS